MEYHFFSHLGSVIVLPALQAPPAANASRPQVGFLFLFFSHNLNFWVFKVSYIFTDDLHIDPRRDPLGDLTEVQFRNIPSGSNVSTNKVT